MLTQFERDLLNQFKGIIRQENPHDGRAPFSREILIDVIKRKIGELEEMKEGDEEVSSILAKNSVPKKSCPHVVCHQCGVGGDY